MGDNSCCSGMTARDQVGYPKVYKMTLRLGVNNKLSSLSYITE